MSVRAAGVLTRPHTRKRLGHNRVGDPRSPAIVAGGDSDAGDQLHDSCKEPATRHWKVSKPVGKISSAEISI